VLVIAITIAWSVQSALSKSASLTWTWLAGDCHGRPGAILEDQVVYADRGTELCIVPPSYLCRRSSGAPVRWHVDIEVDGEIFYGSTSPATRHCIVVGTQPVIIQSNTYCTTFATRYSGRITFESVDREASVFKQSEAAD
jgi:hypothetical protein